MSLADRIKKSKIIKNIALAGAAVSCMLSAPVLADHKPQTSLASAQLFLPDTSLETLLKKKMEPTLPGSEPKNYIPFQTEADRKENYGAISGHATIGDVTWKNFPEYEKLEAASSRIDPKMTLPLNVALGFVATVGWHEFGHYVMGRITGCHVNDFQGPTNGTTIAAVYWSCSDGSNSKPLQSMRSLAGVSFTTASNVALETLLKKDQIPEGARPTVATTALLMMLDRHRYIWSAAMKNFARTNINSSNDIHQVMTRHSESQKEVDAVYAIALVASSAELYLRRHDMLYLMKTALGKDATAPEVRDTDVGMYFAENSVFMGVRGKW